MKVLIADQDARLLEAISATFGRHCDVVTVSNREDCVAQLGKHDVDVIVAGDKLVRYTGLELLSEVAAASPATLRLFLASPERLAELADRLDFFGLYGTLTYPLDPRKLLAELRRARESLKSSTASRKIRHVVLQENWDTGERLGLIDAEGAAVALPEPPVLSSATPELDTPVVPSVATAPAPPDTASRTRSMPAKGAIEISYGLQETAPAQPAPARSLAELASMALKKQPLPDLRARTAPVARRSKSWLFAGAGIALAALATAFALSSLRGTEHTPQKAAQRAHVESARLFSTSTSVGTNSAGVLTLSAPQPSPK